MANLLDRHRNLLLTVATVLGLAGLIWLDSQRGQLSEGVEAPGVSFEVLGEGRSVALADLRGKPVVLDFWATWCAPCRATMPELDAVATAHAGKAHFFAVNTQDEPAAAQEAFRRELGVKLPFVQAGSGAALAFKVEVLPTTVVLDKDGKVARTFVGKTSAVALERVLGPLE